MKQIVLSIVAIIVLFFGPANAEMVKIPWHTSTQSSPWIPGNEYIDGWSKNFMNGTVEEKGKVKADGELQAEMIRPRGTKGPIPFVIMLHGCSGAREWNFASDYGEKLVRAGYGILVLDSFTTRGVGPDGVCSDPSQLNWARRRADDAYAALDWLIDQKIGDSKHVYVVGRSNGATTTLIIMNRLIGDLHEHMFAGGFAMQPSCYLMKNVEFYAPVHLFLAEKDEATSPVLCGQMAESKRAVPVQATLWKGAYHAFEDHYSVHMFHGYHIGYHRDAAEGTIKAIIADLNVAQKAAR
ncbi:MULTISPECIES: dienelactone hydrolase family protein [unclassified Bradyrhizobium]|uniref:dienelactone hydrolase family protein n=1 Tax=unclassified Bradyrhizobium TaxID=2631580 RepID=UPI00291704D8|nr:MULTISPECIES: dienelactone hydrolase family protein [unclassified Bradyrhizobium]